MSVESSELRPCAKLNLKNATGKRKLSQIREADSESTVTYILIFLKKNWTRLPRKSKSKSRKPRRNLKERRRKRKENSRKLQTRRKGSRRDLKESKRSWPKSRRNVKMN